jgi:hypothetical protein
MAKSVIASYAGIDYQSRVFWQEVCRLFHSHTRVKKVGFEIDHVKSFDDVGVIYLEPLHDSYCEGYLADYYQVKYHVDFAGTIGYKSLIDPKFINAESTSLLSRLNEAQKIHAPNGNEARFFFLTTWSIDTSDPLAKLVSSEEGEIRLDLLFGDLDSYRSFRLVKQVWKDHLGIVSDDELRLVLQPFRILPSFGTMRQTLKTLNTSLSLAGLKNVDDGHVINPYDELIRKVRKEGRIWFGKQEIEEICKRERLWEGQKVVQESAAIQIGIRSFFRYAEHMEDEVDHMLCLTKYFDGRIIRSPELWQESIFPEIEDFLNSTIQGKSAYDLRLDTHGSIAFAAGYSIGSKSGKDISILRISGVQKIAWHLDPNVIKNTEGNWAFKVKERQSPTGNDIALAVNITFEIENDVEGYVQRALPQVSKFINCSVLPKPGRESILDANHAYCLAQNLVEWIRKNLSHEERRATLHIFPSAPNVFLFYFGQLAKPLGLCVLYEYEFGGIEPDAYYQSLCFPQKPFSSSR